MEPDLVTIVLAVFTGLGLAAACGLRVFLPLLVLGLAARSEAVQLVDSFAWVSSTPALIAFGVASVLEVLAFYVPWLDNLLDAIALPAASIAGAVATTSVLIGMEPLWTWSLGVVAGGGVAALVHVPVAAARAGSTVTTGGAGNATVATGEVVGSGLVSSMAVFAPITAPMVTIALVVGSVALLRRRRRQAREAT